MDNSGERCGMYLRKFWRLPQRWRKSLCWLKATVFSFVSSLLTLCGSLRTFSSCVLHLSFPFIYFVKNNISNHTPLWFPVQRNMYETGIWGQVLLSQHLSLMDDYLPVINWYESNRSNILKNIWQLIKILINLVKNKK